MFGECPLTGSGERRPARVAKGGFVKPGPAVIRTCEPKRPVHSSGPGIRAQGFGPCEETEQTGQRNRTHSRRGHDPIQI